MRFGRFWSLERSVGRSVGLLAARSIGQQHATGAARGVGAEGSPALGVLDQLAGRRRDTERVGAAAYGEIAVEQDVGIAEHPHGDVVGGP